MAGNTLVVIICGSAASWMIRNVVNSKGGLHNRITRKIRLLPFTLSETAKYLQEKNIKLGHYHILQLYMVMGGIPHYLKEVKKGESATQAIDRICFSKDGLLQSEFKNLYNSLFDDATRHLAVIRTLAKNKSGLTRNQIMEDTKMQSGGTVTELLTELIESGFVTDWPPYDKKSRDTIYKLADEYTHFYLKFVEKTVPTAMEPGKTFRQVNPGVVVVDWHSKGFCLKHIPQLQRKWKVKKMYLNMQPERKNPFSSR